MVAHTGHGGMDGQQGAGVAVDIESFLRGDPRGFTADEVAQALGMPGAGLATQGQLEALVARGALHRHGLGRGALYTLERAAPRPRARPRGVRVADRSDVSRHHGGTDHR